MQLLDIFLQLNQLELKRQEEEKYLLEEKIDRSMDGLLINLIIQNIHSMILIMDSFLMQITISPMN